MSRLLVIALCCAACGRWHFDPLAGTSDATFDAPCTLGPFSAPVIVDNVNALGPGKDDWNPSISADDQTLYFYSLRASAPGPPDIWRATRASASLPFSAPQVITEVSSAASDWSPHVSADELVMVLTSTRLTATFDMYEATRPAREMAFGTPVPLASINTTGEEDTVWLSADGLRIVFSSDVGTSSIDLYRADRADRASSFQNVQPMTELQSPDIDLAPALSSDELEIFFSSTRPGGLGGYDIWHATRASRNDPFGPVEDLTVLNGSLDDYSPSLSTDGTRLYYTYAGQVAGGGDANIYVATRSCQ